MDPTKPAFEFLPGQAVATDARLVDFRVEVLIEGAVLVHARPAIALEQETYHCYVRHLADADLPIAADDFCALLGADKPPSLTPDVLAMAKAPLRCGEYDALLAPLRLQRHPHQGLRVSCPHDYDAGNGRYEHDEQGVFVLAPEQATSANGRYYGHVVAQAAPSELYRGRLDEVAVVLLPLVGSASLSESRIADYERRLEGGATPTALAFGFYANARCLVLAVLDGHHKLAAAAASGRPGYLLALVSPRLLMNYEEMSRVQEPGQLDSIRQRLAALARSCRSGAARR
jgi:hypothetical protein